MVGYVKVRDSGLNDRLMGSGSFLLPSQLEKYKRAEFGRCPRVLCYQQSLLPVGLSDLPFQKAVKLFCPRCEDIYSPKSSRHGTIDGAFFGTTFPHMLVRVSATMMMTTTTHGLSLAGADMTIIFLYAVYGIPPYAPIKITHIAIALSPYVRCPCP